MVSFILHFKRFCFKKRDGISLVEALILILVVAFTVGAMLQTSILTTQLQTAGRKYIESHKSLVSFFHTLESVEAKDILNADTRTIRSYVGSINFIGDVNYDKHYTNVLSPDISVGSGVVTVRIILSDSDLSKKEIFESYNIFSNSTVSDDRVKI
jgi:hypothetical protein